MNTLINSRYFDPVQEKHVNDFEIELTAICQIEGRQTGAQNKPVTEAEFRTFILNMVETRTQTEIDMNHQLNTPVSGMVIAGRVQSEAKEKIRPLTASLTEDEHKLRPLEKQKKQYCPDLAKRKLRRLVNLGIGAISITESYFAYEAFRAAPIPKIPAFFSALGIGVAIGLGSHFLGGYIQKAKSKLQRLLRYCSVLIPAFIGFYFLGHLRAGAYNQAVNFNSQISEMAVPPTNEVSGWSITVISFLLFLVALLFSVRFHKTDEESKRDQEYDRICREIKEVQNKSKITQNNISEISQTASENAAHALTCFEYATAVEKRLQSIAKDAVEVFKSINLKYRTDGLVPIFFSYPTRFNFRLFFDNTKTTKDETVSYTSAD